MSVLDILQLGNPKLRVRCSAVKEFGTQRLRNIADDLKDTLYDFRTKNGFGRGIAAPQIGVIQRVVFIHVEEPIALVNPTIIGRSRKMMTLWDDCFSFPNLLVKVKRYVSIEVHYKDCDGKSHRLRARGGLSELLQHEIDHLNGVLALDRAVDSRHIVFRAEHEKWAGHL